MLVPRKTESSFDRTSSSYYKCLVDYLYFIRIQILNVKAYIIAWFLDNLARLDWASVEDHMLKYVECSWNHGVSYYHGLFENKNRFLNAVLFSLRFSKTQQHKRRKANAGSLDRNPSLLENYRDKPAAWMLRVWISH